MVEMTRGRKAAVTLRNVADNAGVSMMTVSNAINGTGKMSKETRARVRAAIRETGYVPNVEARRLAGAAGTRVGLVYSDGRTPFLAEVLLAALAATAARGTQLIVRDGAGRSVQDADALATQIIHGGGEAFLLVPPFAELLATSSMFAGLGLPAVAFAAAGPLPGMHTVRIDNRAAAELLTTHLVELGHREIGFISGPASNADSSERLAGFRAVMRRHRLPIRAGRVAAGQFTFRSGCDAAGAMLAQANRPTAIVASNDDMAVGAQWVAQQAGLRLPEDLSVAGFDNTAAARRAWPPLTVIQQPIIEMAKVAVDLLVNALTASTPPAPVDRVFEHVLVLRESTCRFAV